MFTLSVQSHFDSAHFLRGYNGPCANLHGHRWELVVRVAAEEVDGIGIAVDFKRIKSALKEVTEDLDHTCLNDHEQFRALNPTAENLARFLYERLSFEISGLGAQVVGVEVWESEDCCVSYVA